MAGLLHLALTKCSRVRQFGASIRSHDIIEVNTTRSAQSLESEIAILRDRFELLEAAHVKRGLNVEGFIKPAPPPVTQQGGGLIPNVSARLMPTYPVMKVAQQQ